MKGKVKSRVDIAKRTIALFLKKIIEIKAQLMTMLKPKVLIVELKGLFDIVLKSKPCVE